MFLSLEMETLATEQGCYWGRMLTSSSSSRGTHDNTKNQDTHGVCVLLGQNADQLFQLKPGNTRGLCVIPKHTTLS